MQRHPRFWRTRFASFVDSFGGVGALARELAVEGEPVTKFAVYNWITGRRSPRADAAAAVVRISDGALQLEDVYGHRQEVGDGGDGGVRRGRAGSLASRAT